MQEQDNLIRLEPKFCELCGALWLRPEGSGSLCCPRCLPLDAELALARRARDEARPA